MDEIAIDRRNERNCLEIRGIAGEALTLNTMDLIVKQDQSSKWLHVPTAIFSRGLTIEKLVDQFRFGGL